MEKPSTSTITSSGALPRTWGEAAPLPPLRRTTIPCQPSIAVARSEPRRTSAAPSSVTGCPLAAWTSRSGKRHRHRFQSHRRLRVQARKELEPQRDVERYPTAATTITEVPAGAPPRTNRPSGPDCARERPEFHAGGSDRRPVRGVDHPPADDHRRLRGERHRQQRRGAHHAQRSPHPAGPSPGRSGTSCGDPSRHGVTATGHRNTDESTSSRNTSPGVP